MVIVRLINVIICDNVVVTMVISKLISCGVFGVCCNLNWCVKILLM